MRAALGLLLAPLALATSSGQQVPDVAQQAQASQAAIAAQEATISNSMGKHFRSKYAPNMPAIPAQSYDASQAQSQPELAKRMGDFYTSKFAAPYTAGSPAAGASFQEGTEAQQQQKIADDMGKFYRSQFAPQGVEAQVKSRQRAIDAQMRTASKPSSDATPEMLLEAQATDVAQQAQASQAAIAAQEAKISNSMGKHFRSKYAPNMPAIPAQSYDASQAQSQPELAKRMGDFYKSKFAAPYTAGIPAAGASSQEGTDAQQPQKIAADTGKLYRSQFAPPGVEAQADAQQRAFDAHMRTASATPEMLLEASPPSAEEGTTKSSVPQSATDCKTKDELDAWYKAQSDNLKKFVPKAYQHFPLESLKKEYDTNLKRIEAPPTEAPADITDLHPAVALESKPPDSLRQVVDEMGKKVHGKVDGAADRATNKFGTFADSFKHGFDSAAHKVRSQADAALHEAPKVRAEAQKRIDQEHIGGQSPKVLAAESPSPLTSRTLRALMLVMGSGAVVSLWLQQRGRPAEELMSEEGFDYHIQA